MAQFMPRYNPDIMYNVALTEEEKDQLDKIIDAYSVGQDIPEELCEKIYRNISAVNHLIGRMSHPLRDGQGMAALKLVNDKFRHRYHFDITFGWLFCPEFERLKRMEETKHAAMMQQMLTPFSPASLPQIASPGSVQGSPMPRIINPALTPTSPFSQYTTSSPDTSIAGSEMSVGSVGHIQTQNVYLYCFSTPSPSTKSSPKRHRGRSTSRENSTSARYSDGPEDIIRESETRRRSSKKRRSSSRRTPRSSREEFYDWYSQDEEDDEESYESDRWRRRTSSGRRSRRSSTGQSRDDDDGEGKKKKRKTLSAERDRYGRRRRSDSYSRSDSDRRRLRYSDSRE